MIKIPKTVMIIAAIIVVVIVVLASVPAFDWDEGAPTASIAVLIEKADSDIYYESDVEIQPESTFDKILSAAQPMTAYNADVAPLDALGIYTISFTITVNTVGNVAEQYTTEITVTGHNNKTSYPVTGATGKRTYGIGFYATGGTTSTLAQTTQYNTPSAFAMPVFDGIKEANGEIAGEFIDGSVFLINIISQGASGSYGTTSATVTITVGAGGSLYVEIADITTTVG